MNAYVVFAHPAPDRPSNLPPILDPNEAVKLIIAKGNNSLFHSHHLRLDIVRPTLAQITASATASGMSTLPARRAIWGAGKDPKCTVFVGGLDHAAGEEDVRLFFEGLVEGERGKRVVEGEEKAWVVDVRIIRDKETQIGKGIAYINFCVSLILLICRSV